MTLRQVLFGAIIGILLLLIAVLGGALAAEVVYGEAVAACARHGAVPGPTETLAYVCVPAR